MQTICSAPIEFVDSIRSNRHILLLYEDPEYAKIVIFRFIKNGLANGEQCIYITDEDSGSIVIKMLTYGISLHHLQSNMVRVLQIGNRYGNRQEIISSCEKDIVVATMNLRKPFRVVSRIVPNVNTEVGISVEMEFEKHAHKEFNEFGGSIMCPYDISKIERSKKKQWLEELYENHHAVIYVPREGSGGVFMNPINDSQKAFM